MLQNLVEQLRKRFDGKLVSCTVAFDEVTVELAGEHLREVCLALRDEPEFGFEVLIDVCGVDYAAWGQVEWDAEGASSSGFSRGVELRDAPADDFPARFAAVYHLLSVRNNQRLRLRVFAEGELPAVDSVVDIWSSADWFEREAFDLYGILFRGHPDLRRILTDYGFVGHPFRKDFPLSGHVEMRYDEGKKRVVYEPVSIEPRTLVPKVVREDHRYAGREFAGEEGREF